MTEKEFFQRVTNGKRDVLQEFLDILGKEQIPYCVIGGVAVNAYAEPVISLDLDIVIALENIDKVLQALPKEWSTKKERFSINISFPYSDLRIQIQTDSRYREFIGRAVKGATLGYEFSVARIEDLLQGKIWAYLEPERRETKRLKDLLDIKRLLETDKRLLELVPENVRQKLLAL